MQRAAGDTPPFTVRLATDVRKRVVRLASRKGMSVSEAIRQAIERWAEEEEATGSPYATLADVIGVVHGGDPERSTATGRRFARLLADGRNRSERDPR